MDHYMNCPVLLQVVDHALADVDGPEWTLAMIDAETSHWIKTGELPACNCAER